jgi:hypothetical protein
MHTPGFWPSLATHWASVVQATQVFDEQIGVAPLH